MLVALLVLPSQAWAFPFVMVGAASGVAPLLLAVAGVLVKRRSLAPLLALVTLALMVLTPDEPSAYREQMRTDSRVLESVIGEDRLAHLIVPDEPSAGQAVTLAQARVDGNLLWVERLATTAQRGLTLEQVIERRHELAPNTVFLSDGEGLTARAAALATGQRWVGSGLNAVLAELPVDHAATPVEALPDCSASRCLRVGLHLNYQNVWDGFPRANIDLNLRVEDLLLPGRAPTELLAQRTEGGRIPVVLVVFNAPDLEHNQRWASLLRQYLPPGSELSVLASLQAFNERSSLQDQMVAYLGAGYQPPVLPAELRQACGRGEQLVVVTPHHPVWAQVIRIPASLGDCRVLDLPLEGLLPEELDAYIDGHSDEFALLRQNRIVGLYLDEPDLYAIYLLKEALVQRGYAWSGTVFGYDSQKDGLAWLNARIDQLLYALYERWPGAGHQVSVDWFWALGLGSMLLIGQLFVWMRGRWRAAILFVAMLFLAMLLHRAFYRLPLDSWRDPYLFIVLALAITSVTALLRERYLHAGSSKHDAIHRLAALGLSVPPGRALRRIDPAIFTRACRKIGYPAIFRSNELTAENREIATMGAYASVVVHGPDDYPQVLAAWQVMEETPGARPSFLVQPWLPFLATGVVRTGLWHEGRACVRVESSAQAEGVTGNQPSAVSSRLLDLEACVCADEPLLRNIARVVEVYPQPLLLEFGQRTDGQVIWLQMQELADDDLLLRDGGLSQAYQRSPLNDEFTASSRGIPLLLSLFNASVPFMQWRLQGRMIVERRRAGLALVQLLAKALPWWLLRILASYALRRERCQFWQRSTRLVWLRSWLLLDSLVLLKGVSRDVDEYRSGQVDAELAAVVSPYGQFAELAHLLASARLPEAVPIRVRQRRSFIVRETLRQALSYALAGFSREVQERLQRDGFAPQSLDCLTLRDIRGTQTLRPRPLFIEALESGAAGLREIGSVCVEIDSPASIEQARQQLLGVGDACVRAPQPWLGLFALVGHVACFDIAAPVQHNSHFMQRAAALGIAVRSGR